MNFLAHAFLAGDRTEDRLGGLIGDFVKGPLPAGLPPDVAFGVWLHRRIDSFADAHPVFQRSRERVSPTRRRVAGIMVDMFYDHFLAANWDEFHPWPLKVYTAAAYRLMTENEDVLPPRLGEILPRMRDSDWLASYRDPDAVAAALDRMSARLSRTDMLVGSGTELQRDYAGFESDFRHFMPDALDFAARVRATRVSESE